MKFTNAWQGLMYTNSKDWYVDCECFLLANLTSTGSAANTTHPKQLTLTIKQSQLAPISINEVHSYDLCTASFTYTISNGWCWTMLLFLVAMLVQFSNAKPAVPNIPTILYQYKKFEFYPPSTIVKLHVVLCTVLDSLLWLLCSTVS